MNRVWIFTVFILGLLCDVSEGTCSARGRFPNENVPNCQGYTMCLQGAPGVYTQLDLNCPDNFVYSHIDNQCTNVTSYQCYPEYKCVSVGNFEGSKDKKCTMYVACVQGLNQLTTARLIQCPENTLFSPEQGACVSNTTFTCENEAKPDVIDVMPSQESSNTSTNNALNLCSNYAVLIYLIAIVAV
ncbi:uncharacterized protein LOC125229017 [Leguminivora glycinivorella]|uniref:uncharacterized protein LOC125229017 n=1 Tax=Leguminivora glycinivorella TaxID=1035111 RepID=UPI00200F5CE3|nr:uncharacterized protein LOC125229017 [Leguminivora glycinivorella]